MHGSGFYLLLMCACVLVMLGVVACSRGESAMDYKSFPSPKDDLTADPKHPLQTMVVAGGCFWCTEGLFEETPGVVSVVAGYAGGTQKSADYETVSSGEPGHAEAIQITYDASKTSYGKLLKTFFALAHDPTELDRQGPDTGHQYRSAIFFANNDEKRIAESYIKQLNEAKVFPTPIVTTVEPLNGFYPAEQYHQKFVKLHPDHPYIQQEAIPKIEKAREVFAAEKEQPATTQSSASPKP